MPTIAMISHGALPALRITSIDGAEAIVTLYGAHLVSWKTADGAERLFCSASSAMDGSGAIRGGVPVIFPQFAARGSGMRHGFARVSTWRLADRGASEDGAFAAFALGPADLAPAIAAAWPHAFALTLRLALAGDTLSLTLEVHNTGADAFAFSAALHTYFAVSDLDTVRIGGVQEGALQLADKLDEIYFGINGAMTLEHGGGMLTLAQQGFTDAVVWNPGAADSAALADMGDDEYLRFVCIEPALIEAATLAGGDSWHGAHQVRAAPAG